MTLFFAALLFGIVFCLSPGAVLAETLRRGLKGGFRPALLVQFGSLIGDAVWALIGLTGLALLFGHETLRLPLTLASAAYLAWLGVQSLRDAREVGVVEEGDTGEHNAGAFASGAMLSLSNPKNIVYWGALGGAMAGLVDGVPSLADSLVFFAGFMTASVLCCFLCAGLVDWLRRNASPRWHRVSHALCGVVLLVLAGLALRGI
ncbi:MULTISPECIES: LysE family translocator [Pseudomonas]|uniref:LysE family translocator n=1 Tax=Pseudomonas nitroreducens TaxID=46680 RepID=A0A6G6IQD5_PSENT|nr:MULTISPECIES: LysE family translocator [Pseudomonas]MBG6286604.1 LysE family translocator [Pseudomonas nitroreducens]MCP1652029.1 chemosensory pili system protein ChpE [Pseudomonas nitroreducens]MCP1689048.1 chemosensory pili system protein ChpE [Pseudomonas nitroreducens]MDH1071851.1 LysE family translocator [Pseudomonas nitroreducens]NNN22958.1 LysE family transporter [Pseudomonas nitroreducens]